jgi:hypothetical protein
VLAPQRIKFGHPEKLHLFYESANISNCLNDHNVSQSRVPESCDAADAGNKCGA